jgi:anti-sigma factor RsiW
MSETPEQLTPEQLVTVARWEREKVARQAIYDRFEKEGFTQALVDALGDASARMCEHERSVVGSCFACEEIERILEGRPREDEE